MHTNIARPATLLERMGELKDKLLTQITAIITEKPEDDHPIYNKDLIDKADMYRGVWDNGLAFMAIELSSGYKLVLVDEPSCCAQHYFEFPADEIEHLIGNQMLAVFADPSTETSEEEEYGQTKDSLTMGLFTDKLMVRFPIYNSHNGYYGGIEPQLIIVDDQGQYVGHGQVPPCKLDQLLSLAPAQTLALS